MISNNIYSFLISIKNYNLHYLNRYIKFINFYQNISFDGNGTHKHHILPKALFPEFSDLIKNPWNEIILPIKHHRLAHILLAKAYPNTNMACALLFFGYSEDILGTNWYNDGKFNFRLHERNSNGLNKGRVSTDAWKNKTYVSKNNINKSINISDLDTYLSNGWQKKLIKENVISVTDGIMNTAVREKDVDYFLSCNLNFKKGYIIKSNRRMKNNSFIFHNPKTGKECRLLRYEEDSFIANGWVRGRSSINKDKFRFAANQINKDGKGKRVSNSELQSFLDNGWKIGLPENLANGNKTKALGKYRIYKDLIEKLILPEMLEEYLVNGWKRGRSPKFIDSFVSSISS